MTDLQIIRLYLRATRLLIQTHRRKISATRLIRGRASRNRRRVLRRAVRQEKWLVRKIESGEYRPILSEMLDVV